jgi:N-formylglutamate amidohydrolase
MSGHEPTVIRPAAPSPLVVSVPHAGTLIPEAELHRYALSSEVLAADVDLFVDRLYAEAPALGATLISTPVSRFVVDLNRFEDDLCPSVVLGSSRNTAAGYYGNRGVIWGVSTRGESIYRLPLPREVHEARIAAFYAPYHALLAAELERARATFGFAILLDAHSMPSVAKAAHTDAGERRADIWQEQGRTVALNKPYRGGAITRRYGRPSEGIHAIQLELNRGLYMDETACEPSDGFAELAETCSALVERLIGFRPQ